MSSYRLRVEKVISSLPGTLAPNTLYIVRTGVGVDFYTSDLTGSVAYRQNGSGWGSIAGTLADQTDLKAVLDDKQPLDATLTGIAALTITAGQVPYATGTDTFSTFSTTTNGRALLNIPDLYGLGTITAAIAADLDLLTGKGQWFRWGVSTLHAPTGVGLGNSGVGIHLPRASTGSNDVQMAFDTNGRPAVRVCTSGTWGAWFVMYSSNNPIPYNTTTASSPNAVISSTGEILRSTSSEEFKDPIEVIDLAYSMALLDIDGIWYRSTLPADDPNWSFYGFTAEAVSEKDPRLASWCTTEEYEETQIVSVGTDEKGQQITEEVKVKKIRPCTPYPNGVNYERFVPHHHMLIKKLFDEIEDLKAQISHLQPV